MFKSKSACFGEYDTLRVTFLIKIVGVFVSSSFWNTLTKETPSSCKILRKSALCHSSVITVVSANSILSSLLINGILFAITELCSKALHEILITSISVFGTNTLIYDSLSS